MMIMKLVLKVKILKLIISNIIIMETYYKSIIYGGTDGIITMFNIISGIRGANLNITYSIIISLSVLISDAVSMRFSDYSSTKIDKKLGYTNNNEIKSGIITFLSFIFFGMIPLSLFLGLYIQTNQNAFVYSAIIVFISLFILGVFKSKLTGDNYLKSGLSTSTYGLTASMTSYFIANKLSKVIKNI